MAENYFGITDTGRLRDNNEDAFIAEPVFKNLIAACVIDGVGGYEGGEVAAAIAKKSIADACKRPAEAILKMMLQALAAANEKIYKEKIQSEKNNSMACVVTLAIIDANSNKFYYAHVGDTRLYLLRDKSLVKVTKDQSFVGFLEDSGRLSEADAMAHPKRNEINKALGFDQQISLQSDYIDSGESPFLSGDLLLLCSDGLTDMITSAEIISILTATTSLEEKGKKLVVAANEAGGKDNITVVLVHNNKKPIRQKATKPVLVKRIEKENETEDNNKIKTIIETTVKQPKSGKGIIALLSFLSIIFLAGFLWMLQKHYKKEPISQRGAKTEKNEGEKRLQKAIDSSGSGVLFLTDSIFGNTIFLTDTIWIKKDSLQIFGNGITLVSDSSFANSGAAIALAPQCKHIVIDSLTLQDFKLALLSHNNNSLQIKNVQFKNCSIVMAYQSAADSLSMSGSFINSGRTEKDSLPNYNRR